MTNAELTIERIHEEVQTMLGASAIDVEITQDIIKTVARRAMRMHNRYLPYRGRATLAITQATKKYRVDNLPEIPSTFRFKGITHIDFIQRRVDPAGVDPFDPYVTSLVGPNYGDETFADVYQRRAYAEDAQRIISSEPDWYGQWEEAEYYVYISIERTDTTAGLFWIAGYPDTDSGRFFLPGSEVDWFMDWCIAESKQVLARIRGKFAGIQNPDGGLDEIDWRELQEEGRSEKERLEQEIRMRKRPYLPVIE